MDAGLGHDLAGPVSGDTWVALDGTDPDVFFTGTACWISDTGAYTGAVPIVELADALWVPDDAARVVYLIVPPNPDAQDDHVLGTGAYAYTVTNPYEQDYAASGITETGDPAAPDSGSHLFVVWFPLGPVTDPVDLPTLIVSPLDLAPVGWVSGGRLTLSSGGSDTPETGADGGAPADPDAVTVTLHDTDGSLLGTLGIVNAVQWQHELSAPGSLTCKVGEDDPLYADLTPKRIVKAWWRGSPRMAARIDSSGIDLAQDGRRRDPTRRPRRTPAPSSTSAAPSPCRTTSTIRCSRPPTTT
jgi:hypothetical protein